MDMVKIIKKYPQLAKRKNAEIRQAVECGRYVIANDYLNDTVYEANCITLYNRPLVLISRQAVNKYLKPTKKATERGWSLKQNIVDLVNNYNPGGYTILETYTEGASETEYTRFDTAVLDKSAKDNLIIQFTAADDFDEPLADLPDYRPTNREKKLDDWAKMYIASLESKRAIMQQKIQKKHRSHKPVLQGPLEWITTNSTNSNNSMAQ